MNVEKNSFFFTNLTPYCLALAKFIQTYAKLALSVIGSWKFSRNKSKRG